MAADAGGPDLVAVVLNFGSGRGAIRSLPQSPPWKGIIPMNVGKHVFTALAALVLCTGVAAPALKAQELPAPGQYPWSVAILNKTASGFSFRGNGVLISSTCVLTTAGVVDGAQSSSLSVEAGTNHLGNGTIAPVSDYRMHSEFGVGSVTYSNDIAVVYLAEPLPIGGFIQLADLPLDQGNFHTGETALVSGWWRPGCVAGLSNSLLDGSIQVISTGEAASMLDNVPGATVWDNQLCLYDASQNFTPWGYAKGSGICAVDSGHFVVAGLCSWGVTPELLAGGMYDYAGCMLAGFPHVGTRVSAYKDWILANMNGGGGGGTLLPSLYTNLGNGMPGTGGETPMLVFSGYLTPGLGVQLELSNVPAGAMSQLVIGLSLFNAPFKSGVMVPGAPYIFPQLMPAGGDGTLSLAAHWPSNVPAGVNLYLQEWILDAGGPQGFAASNALKILTP
jgi:hypothetical protein